MTSVRRRLTTDMINALVDVRVQHAKEASEAEHSKKADHAKKADHSKNADLAKQANQATQANNANTLANKSLTYFHEIITEAKNHQSWTRIYQGSSKKLTLPQEYRGRFLVIGAHPVASSGEVTAFTVELNYPAAVNCKSSSSYVTNNCVVTLYDNNEIKVHYTSAPAKKYYIREIYHMGGI